MEQNNTITVTGCGDCPMYVKLPTLNYQWCGYPNNPYASAELRVDLHATCPLKTNSLTIQLKQDEA
jgi:hypothetical protein